jgi:predicted DNA-binding transcriptional regulator YafY
MLSVDEVEALTLGALWVGERADSELAKAAEGALAKLAAVMPPDRAELVAAPSSLVAPGGRSGLGDAHLKPIRAAIHGERKLALSYVDAGGAKTQRVVWPMAITYFEAALILVAWCETRAAFRHFRVDRIETAEERPERCPRRRRALLAEWKQAQTGARPTSS